jgi:isoleucyl-tRNA synthetase
MRYNTDRAYWEKWFPGNFITESFPGQFRNWFYSLLAMSTMMVNRLPTRVILGHGLVRDQWDRPMHKTAGNSIPFEGAADEGYTLTDPKGARSHYPPMSADLIRWLFCRSNPSNNVDFGPGPADELRSKFTLKLWNTFAFFCDNARQAKGGFDVAAPEIPVKQRPDMDRWILSDLQLLVRKAREEFERFSVMAFCLEAEKFVDERLSNWYVRRNKRRFWKSEESEDKLAAYQTLYTILLTFTKLCAPVMPFLTEVMYQNLAAGKAKLPSVHLSDFPEPDESLIDQELSDDMEALLDLVKLGSAARNTVKIKVRQPLAEMRVQPAGDRERRAVERFADQFCDELNIKKVTLIERGQGPLLLPEVKSNPKTMGPKFGPRLKEVQAALANLDPIVACERLQASQALELDCPSGPVTLEPADVVMQQKAPEGWAGAAERGTQVAIDTRITEALELEGLAREVVRQVQELRKQSALQMEDRIELYLGTDSPKLRQAIETHRAYIASETLTVRWSSKPLEGPDVHRTTVKIGGQTLTIELRKI